MKEMFFILGMIWVLTSVGSLLLGPIVGFDRKKIKQELLEFYRDLPSEYFKRIPIFAILHFALLGFLLPALYPVYGFFVGCLFFAFI